MLAGRSEPRPTTVDELIGADLAVRLDRLDLLSRKILAGKLPGERRSKRRGRSVEFEDFRTYAHGDDPRHIDWNAFARLERLFIKIFREEEDLSLHLVVDASASMDAGRPGKLAFAHRLAMALAYVGLVNQNRVSVTSFGASGGLVRLAPCRGRPSLRLVADFLLARLSPRAPGAGGEPASLAAAMRSLGASGAARGIVVVMSDFLASDGCEEALTYLGAASMSGAVDAFALQTLSPGELDPASERDAGLIGDLRLTDAESGGAAEVTVTPDSIRRYRRNLDEYIAGLRARCLSRGVAHSLVPTDTPIDQLVIGSLRRGGMLR